MENKILVTRSSMPDYEEYCEEIKELWDSHWLTNMGTKHKQFQAELEKLLDVPHISLYTNGHLALDSVLETVGLADWVWSFEIYFDYLLNRWQLLKHWLSDRGPPLRSRVPRRVPSKGFPDTSSPQWD